MVQRERLIELISVHVAVSCSCASGQGSCTLQSAENGLFTLLEKKSISLSCAGTILAAILSDEQAIFRMQLFDTDALRVRLEGPAVENSSNPYWSTPLESTGLIQKRSSFIGVHLFVMIFMAIVRPKCVPRCCIDPGMTAL